MRPCLFAAQACGTWGLAIGLLGCSLAGATPPPAETGQPVEPRQPTELPEPATAWAAAGTEQRSIPATASAPAPTPPIAGSGAAEGNRAVPVQPPAVRESELDFAARAQTATTLGSPLLLSEMLAEPFLPFRDGPPDSRKSPVLPRSEIADQSPTIADPELGVLRLRPSPPASTGDTPASNPMPVPQPNCDPELGCLRLKVPPLPPIGVAPPRAPVIYLIARADYFRNSNLFSDRNPIAEGLSRPGLTLYTSPTIGRNTFLVASATGNLLRYATQSQLNSNELFFRAGILQRLSPTMFGEIGWSNQQLFISGDKLIGLPSGTRFLNEHAIRLELSRRDRLSEKLSLSSFYQFRYSFADPISRSRLTHALSLSLNYDLQPNLQLGLDYQLGLASFTQQNRHDLYNQVLGRLTYTPLRNTQVSAFVGYGFGNSTDQTIRFNSLLVGVSLNLTLGLF